MEQLLILLGWVPVACYQIVKKESDKKWMLTGISLGAVIAPISFGLVKMIYATGILKLFGVVGLVLNIIHGPIGYMMATMAGLIKAGVALTGPELVIINLLNALLWASFYGSVGYNIDLKVASEAGAGHPVPVGASPQAG
ncbi:hypothetical protein [Thiovibrio frasassiensis]|jgi:hypothetical protein|uniref:Uncharacterized protein n=1 Tax=Thiovibrio frasassiensis TaxID=2984131 RepID=A0A9X4MCM4_9BACT|nr:hypothetical protein [Thiovibrio frasassiensis]MDG4474976.1 hypothetical protein [Thiovibrio frasassiensis]